jgi:hypothetical protein
MKQNAEIRFKCTTEQKDKIKKKASDIGMTLKSYLIYVGTTAQVSISIMEDKGNKTPQRNLKAN